MPSYLPQMGVVPVIVALFGLAGCRLDELRFGRGAAKTSARSEEVQRLSEKQVADVQLSLARTLEMEGEIDAAMDAYRKAIEKAPKQSTGYWRMAVSNDRQGHVLESANLYRQALKLDPKNGDIHCDYGYSLYLQRRWAEAEAQLREALAISPKNRRGHNNFGLLLAQTERFDEALAEFRLAGCSEDDARINLAFVAMLNQRWDQAREEFQRALDANPASEAARVGREKLAALTARANGERRAVALAADRRGATGGNPQRSTSGVAPAAWAGRAPLRPNGSVR
ncbi:MAG TPA: tetratricopeptide repeat protein [Pirellulales bacterium]|nr:tetratricopeptide repeat protein [Pirellulales bacterium]